jgi:TolB protein
VSDLQLEDSWMSSRNNGKEMIVSGRQDKERMQLFIIDIDNGNYKKLTHDIAAMYRDPLFSPDGSKIIFVYKQNRRNRAEYEELYSMNIDGTELLQLTHYPANDTMINSFGYKAGPPRWHPTENFISYISEQTGKTSIYAIMPDGSKQWKLTDIQMNEGWHDWSPDGNWLALDVSDTGGKQYHIILMNWKTKETKQLTDDSFSAQMSPVFVTKE